jgi:hypothetical protein
VGLRASPSVESGSRLLSADCEVVVSSSIPIVLIRCRERQNRTAAATPLARAVARFAGVPAQSLCDARGRFCSFRCVVINLPVWRVRPSSHIRWAYPQTAGTSARSSVERAPSTCAQLLPHSHSAHAPTTTAACCCCCICYKPPKRATPIAVAIVVVTPSPSSLDIRPSSQSCSFCRACPSGHPPLLLLLLLPPALHCAAFLRDCCVIGNHEHSRERAMRLRCGVPGRGVNASLGPGHLPAALPLLSPPMRMAPPSFLPFPLSPFAAAAAVVVAAAALLVCSLGRCTFSLEQCNRSASRRR